MYSNQDIKKKLIIIIQATTLPIKMPVTCILLTQPRFEIGIYQQ